MEYPQAKRCLYNGTWFKSNLEGKVAEALDRLGAEWQYEPVVVRGRDFIGGQYTPDFFLPASSCYLEVAGRWDERHDANARAFFREAGCAEWDEFHRKGRPTFAAVDGRGFLCGIGAQGLCDLPSVFVNRCRACGAVTLMDHAGLYGCGACGAWDGDHFIDPMGGNLLDAAGVKRYGGR